VAGVNGRYETVAVIGSGIAGLTAAYVLQRAWPVTLYEADSRLGGHADTHPINSPDCGSLLALDTGFIVHNEANYPFLMRLFKELGVRTENTDMSLSVGCDGCGLEYSSGSGLRALPRRLQAVSDSSGSDMLAEMVEFNQQARQLLTDGADPELTLDKLLAEGGYSAAFVHHVILPLVSIIWSCDPASAGRYPAGALLAFLDNHGLLMTGDATRWRTVTGGSATYVDRVAATLHEVCRGLPVREVHRAADGVLVRDASDRVRQFDRLVIAVHPAQALDLLADPTAAEREVLAHMPYTRNTAVLHTDSTVLPRQRVNCSSWNHRQTSCRPGAEDVVVSYYLNRLQNIDSETDYIVTFGSSDGIDPATVLARMDYEHPCYTVQSTAARNRLAELTSSVTAYAGAYHGWGFHEDGCRSGVAAAQAFGVSW
jgi:predicted NAD/FAD-binding protein